MTDPLGFSEQMWLSVLDKALLGGIVTLGGFFGTRAIETYKSKQLLRTELTKQRVAKIEEVWKALIALDFEIGKVHESLVTGWSSGVAPGQDTASRLKGARDSWRSRVAARSDSVAPVTSQLDEMTRVIEREAFWLGRDLSEKAQAQLTSMRTGFDRLLAGDTVTIDDQDTLTTSMTRTKHLIDIDYIMRLD